MEDSPALDGFLRAIGLPREQALDGWTIVDPTVTRAAVTVPFRRAFAGREQTVRVRVTPHDGGRSFSRTRSFSLSHDSVSPEMGPAAATLMKAITQRIHACDAGGMALPPASATVEAAAPDANARVDEEVAHTDGDATPLARGYVDRHLVVVPLARLESKAFAELQGEIARVAERYRPHVRTDCVGPPYRTFSLYNSSGSTSAPEADDDHDHGRRLIAGDFPQLQRLVARFEPELQVLAIACSPPGTHLRTHQENVAFPADATRRGRDRYGGTNVLLRLHIPILTDDRAYSTIDGRRYVFEPGALYLYNNSLPHSTDNAADFDRYHLLLDAWLSERLWHDVLSILVARDSHRPVPSPFLRLEEHDPLSSALPASLR